MNLTSHLKYCSLSIDIVLETAMNWLVAIFLLYALVIFGLAVLALDLVVRTCERKGMHGDPHNWLFAMNERRWKTAWEIRNWYLYTNGMWDGTFFGLRLYRDWKKLLPLPNRNNIRWYSYFFGTLIYSDLDYLLNKSGCVRRRYMHPRNRAVRLLFRLPQWLKPYLQWAKPFFLRKEYSLTQRGVAWLENQHEKGKRVAITIENCLTRRE